MHFGYKCLPVLCEFQKLSNFSRLMGLASTLVLHMFLLELFFGILVTVHGIPSTLKVAIVLPEDQKNGAVDFGYKWGIKALNKDPVLLPNTTIIGKTFYVKQGDTFRASKELCKVLGTGIVTILGASSDIDPSLEWKLFWTSAAMDIPLFLPSPSYSHYKAGAEGSTDRLPDPEFAVRLAPTLKAWAMVVRDLVAYLKLNSIAIIYEDEKGLMKMQSLLREPVPVGDIIVRRVTPDTYRQVLAEVKGREIRHLMIDCKLTSLPDLLRAIMTLQMTDYKYHYMLTNVDLATVDMTGFIRANVNLTSFRIVNQESRSLREKWVELRAYGDEDVSSAIWDKKTPSILAETAFAYDSVMVLGRGLSSLDASHNIQPANLSCDRDAPWSDGLSLLNYITAVDYKGLSGPVAFKEGDRSAIKIDVVRLGPTGLKEVGLWSSDRQLNISNHESFWDTGIKNVTLVVTCVLETPYVKLNPAGNLTGNARFEGFSVDLLKLIAKNVGFKYVLEVVPDGKYGVYDIESGEWNGVVRQLIDKSVDLAIGAITINYARESVIDFTKPFMNLGISILFKVPNRREAQLFSFLNPLAVEIWLSVVASYVLVSLTIFIVARFSPNEWSSTTATIKYTGSAAVGVVRNQFSFENAFWYPVGTLMQQGSDLNPKTTSTRIVGGIWWFFSIVIVSSYTANLAAFLTVERMSTPIESAEDLAEQSEIAYGTLESGSTMTFFRDSKIETYQKMWRFMESRKPPVFVSTYDEGIKRVIEGNYGNYAFLMESTSLDYAVKQNCNLTQIGGLLDSKGFGIATPIGSPWRDKISLAILEMQEKGVIQWYYNKWWTPETGKEEIYQCNREYKKQDNKASALGVDSIGGVFVVLVVGLLVAVVVSILEFCWNAKSNATSDEVALCSEMAEEAKFAFRCRGPRRRPALTRHCARCQDGHQKPHTPTAYHDYHTYPHHHHIGAD
ncbi:unnamed protein product [Orchesella dallaii]|uniref:Glutamate receptor ionotropic, kainate 2 n=1 Tax=Orchesella dallaii TaxID=48710 RepID=A0ABP1QPY0_9HEXA